MEFIHPAMWYVALRSYQWIRQVAAPCNVARSSGMTWHRIFKLAAPCNVASGSGIMTLNSPGVSTMQGDTWIWDGMSSNSPSSSTLQCETWLLDHDIEFVRWQHPAIWHVALGSCHWMRQVAAPHNAACGSGMTCHWIRPKRQPYRTTSGFDFDHIAAVHMSLWPVCEILSKSDHPRLKNDVMSFLSRVSVLTRDIHIPNLSVCLSVRSSVRPSVTFRYQMKTA